MEWRGGAVIGGLANPLLKWILDRIRAHRFNKWFNVHSREEAHAWLEAVESTDDRTRLARLARPHFASDDERFRAAESKVNDALLWVRSEAADEALKVVYTMTADSYRPIILLGAHTEPYTDVQIALSLTSEAVGAKFLEYLLPVVERANQGDEEALDICRLVYGFDAYALHGFCLRYGVCLPAPPDGIAN